MPGKAARARGKDKRRKEMERRKAVKKARFLAQRDAGKQKRAAGVVVNNMRYGKNVSGWRTFPGTPPNLSPAPKKPSTRNRPAKYFDAATKTWLRG